jgi:adenylate cyclase
MRKSYYLQLPLAPLAAEAMGELLAELMGRDASLAVLAGRIEERTRGNPFFAEELVQSLAEAGCLEGSRAAYRLARAIDELELPATVQAVLSARIDRLAERDKQLLQTASVIGKELSEAVLRRVAELPEPELQAALSSLTQSEFLSEKTLYPEAEYAFRHPLTQEVAYRSQLGERRARTHGAVASAIAETARDRLDEQAAAVAHHFEEAGKALEAARWHQRAARWIGFSDAFGAVQHWRRVHELAGSLARSSETRGLVIEACTRTLIVGWRAGLAQEEVEKVFRTGMESAREAGDAGAQARLLDGYAMAKSSTVSGDYDEFAGLISQAIALAEQTDDRGLQLALHQRLCWTQTMAGNYHEALPSTEQAIERSGGDVKLGFDVIGWSPYLLLLCLRGAILTGLGRLNEAARALALALDRSREENDRESSVYAVIFLAELAARRGDPEAQLRHAREMVELTDRPGSLFYHLWGHHVLLPALAAKQEWNAALELASELREAATAIPVLLPMNRLPAAQAHLALGDPKNARAAAQETLDALEHLQSLKGMFGIATRLGAAEVLLAADGAPAAQTVLRELETASELIEETGAECHRPKLHELRAELARVRGDGANRERELREAHRLYTEMAAAGHAERLARALTELRVSP